MQAAIPSHLHEMITRLAEMFPFLGRDCIASVVLELQQAAGQSKSKGPTKLAQDLNSVQFLDRVISSLIEMSASRSAKSVAVVDFEAASTVKQHIGEGFREDSVYECTDRDGVAQEGTPVPEVKEGTEGTVGNDDGSDAKLETETHVNPDEEPWTELDELIADIVVELEQGPDLVQAHHDLEQEQEQPEHTAETKRNQSKSKSKSSISKSNHVDNRESEKEKYIQRNNGRASESCSLVRCLTTVTALVGRILDSPNEPKFRRLRKNNQKFQSGMYNQI